MEDDGRGEAAREAKVAPSTLDAEMLSKIHNLEVFYRASEEEDEGLQWSDEALAYYSDYLTEKEKDEFLQVPASDLDYFCRNHDPSWLRNMLSDSVMFFKFHSTWQAYICPIPECLCWFPEDDSLVLHLINEHCNAWPFLRQNPTEEQRCAKALRSTVWKPIDASAAVRLFMFLFYTNDDSLLDADHLASLEWPLSEDFRRSKLLAELQREFEELLGSLERNSFTLLSNGCLRALIAVASEDILRRLDPMNIAPPSFRALLYCSPLSFRFLEEEPLCCFLELVEGIRNLVEDQASQNRELQGSQDSELLDAVSFSAGCDYFVLDGAKLNSCKIDEKRMSSWLIEAPFFPTIKKIPPEASEILQLVRRKAKINAVSFSECLTTVYGQSDLKLAALTSCLKMWNMGHWPTSLHDKSSHESASNSESNAANVDDMPSPSCFAVREPAKRRRTKYDYQMRRYLELIEFTCGLQFFELQVRRLCAIDLRAYILPLLKSYLRMKLYVFINVGHGSATGDDVEEEDADEGDVMEWSREEHADELVYCKVLGETAAEDGSDVMTPDLSSYKRREELYTALPELGSSGSGASGVTDLGPLMIDGGEALGGEPPSARAEDTYSRASQVGCADAALSRSRTGTGAAIAESEAQCEAITESDAEPESKTEPETQCSQEFTGSLFPGSLSYYFHMYSDSDSLSESEGEFRDRGSKMTEFSDVAWDTNVNGLFVRMTITDVAKHCLEQISSCDDAMDNAMNIWGLKTNRTLKYWRCFSCKKRFPDQKSHMLHLESDHDLGISWDHEWFVPSQVQQEGRSGVDEGVKERTHRLDDSITVDRTYRTFIVEMEKIRSSYQNEDEGKAQNVNQFELIVGHINKQICCLKDMFDAKSRLCLTSEITELDAEVVQNFARLKKLKQDLSDLCISDYKNEILPSISCFLQKQNLMDSVFRSWALERLNVWLRSVGSPWHPDSFSIELASPGKVIINIQDSHNAQIGFAYVGICLKFAGDLSGKGSRNITGTFMFSGASDLDDNIDMDRNVILDGKHKMTRKLINFKTEVASFFSWNLVRKLRQFQAEVRMRLRCQQKKLCLYGLK